jgi:hypothetical protein
MRMPSMMPWWLRPWHDDKGTGGREVSEKAGWVCIIIGWVLLAVSGAFCALYVMTVSRGLLAHPGLLAGWATCFVTALALFAAPPAAGWAERRKAIER